MKILKLLFIPLFISLFILSGCNGNDDEKEIIPIYLVDFTRYQPVVSPTAENIAGLLQTFAAQIPGADFSSIIEKVKYDVEIHRVFYKTGFKGDTILASGVVATPVAKGKKDAFPIMSYQHGTIFRKDEAPSVNLAAEYMTYLASTGMVVVIPDYIGFGASAADFHPYMHNEYTVNSVLDMIRASREFVKTEKICDLNDKLFLFGYSQGGSATIGALSAIEGDNRNSDIEVTAVSAGAGAYDLTQLRRWIMQQQRYEKPSFVLYILESFKRYAGVTNTYADIFSSEFAGELPGLIDGQNSEAKINGVFTTYNPENLFNERFLKEFDTDDEYASMRAAFSANKIAGWATNAPVRLYYGTNDTWVPGEQTLRLLQEFQNQGAGSKVSMTRLEGLDHMTAFIPTLSLSLEWFLSY